MKKIIMVGIAGNKNDFLISLPTLKAYLIQFPEIKKEFDIEIMNYSIEDGYEKIAEDVIKNKPSVVCFSCYIWNMHLVKIISSWIKVGIKDVKIIYGGPEISQEGIDNGEYICMPVNELIVGEGEEKLYETLIGKTPKKQEIEDKPSAYLTGCVPEELFKNPDLRINIETQRGCNLKCAYCLYHKNFKRIKYRNPDIVIKEIEYCYKKGVKVGKIVDANFFSDKGFAMKILKGIIGRKIKMRLCFDMLPSFLDEELAGLCKEYVSISVENSLLAGIGLQSLNKESMKSINRIIDLDSLDKSMNLLSEANVTVRLDLILGLPYETKGSYFKALDYVIEKMRLGNHFLGLYLLKLLPGTKLAEQDISRDKDHNAYSTSTMSRPDMIDCLRMNSVAYRLFNPREIDKKIRLSKLFFSIRNLVKISNIEFITKITEYIKNRLPVYSDFLKDDFPYAENYYLKRMFDEISDKDMIRMMKEVEKYANINSKT